MSLNVQKVKLTMNNFLKSWNEFWFSKFDPLSVSIFRILFGLLIVIMFLCNYLNWERFYDANGIFSLNDIGLNSKRFTNEGWWSLFWWTEGRVPIKFYWWLGFVSSIAFTFGFLTRLSTVILFLLFQAMIHRNFLIENGDDQIFRMLLFYCCFAPLSYSISIDKVLRKKFSKDKDSSSEIKLPSIWPIRMMQINIILIYLISLPNKLADDIAWLNGNAVYYTMANNMWVNCPFPELFYKWNGLLSKIATYGTLFIEGAFPILVWIPETKLLIIAFAMLLHLGIALTISVAMFFTLAMVCSFWLFVPATFSKKIFIIR